MHLDRTYVAGDDSVVVEFLDPDLELVIVAGYSHAVWRSSETGEVVHDVEIGEA